LAIHPIAIYPLSIFLLRIVHRETCQHTPTFHLKYHNILFSIHQTLLYFNKIHNKSQPFCCYFANFSKSSAFRKHAFFPIFAFQYPIRRFGQNLPQKPDKVSQLPIKIQITIKFS